MFENKEELKNKIIYRASYRGTKEMDILMISFVKSIIHELNLEQLNQLDNFVNMDDEALMSIKNDELLINFDDSKIFKLVETFKKFKI
jgi:antitoxin CptB